MVIKMKNICMLALGMALGILAYSMKDSNPQIKKMLKKINIE